MDATAIGNLCTWLDVGLMAVERAVQRTGRCESVKIPTDYAYEVRHVLEFLFGKSGLAATVEPVVGGQGQRVLTVTWVGQGAGTETPKLKNAETQKVSAPAQRAEVAD